MYGTKQLGGESPFEPKQLNAPEEIDFDDAEVVDDDIEVGDIIDAEMDYNQSTLPGVKDEESVIQAEEESSNIDQEIEALKDMIDGKKGMGTADKLIEGYVAKGSTLDERNQNLIKFLKSKL